MMIMADVFQQQNFNIIDGEEKKDKVDEGMETDEVEVKSDDKHKLENNKNKE